MRPLWASGCAVAAADGSEQLDDVMPASFVPEVGDLVWREALSTDSSERDEPRIQVFHARTRSRSPHRRFGIEHQVIVAVPVGRTGLARFQGHLPYADAVVLEQDAGADSGSVVLRRARTVAAGEQIDGRNPDRLAVRCDVDRLDPAGSRREDLEAVGRERLSGAG